MFWPVLPLRDAPAERRLPVVVLQRTSALTVSTDPWVSIAPVFATLARAMVPNMPSAATESLVTNDADVFAEFSDCASGVIGAVGSTPVKAVAPAIVDAAPESVTVTLAVPTLGAAIVQISERTPYCAICTAGVSSCGPKLTLLTVTPSAVEMPTASSRALPAGMVSGNETGAPL